MDRRYYSGNHTSTRSQKLILYKWQAPSFCFESASYSAGVFNL